IWLPRRVQCSFEIAHPRAPDPERVAGGLVARNDTTHGFACGVEDHRVRQRSGYTLLYSVGRGVDPSLNRSIPLMHRLVNQGFEARGVAAAGIKGGDHEVPIAGRKRSRPVRPRDELYRVAVRWPCFLVNMCNEHQHFWSVQSNQIFHLALTIRIGAFVSLPPGLAIDRCCALENVRQLSRHPRARQRRGVTRRASACPVATSSVSNTASCRLGPLAYALTTSRHVRRSIS